MDDSGVGSKPVPTETLTALASPERLRVAKTISQDEARRRSEAATRLDALKVASARTMPHLGSKWGR
jgi:hypothetical protein